MWRGCEEHGGEALANNASRHFQLSSRQAPSTLPASALPRLRRSAEMRLAFIHSGTSGRLSLLAEPKGVYSHCFYTSCLLKMRGCTVYHRPQRLLMPCSFSLVLFDLGGIMSCLCTFSVRLLNRKAFITAVH